MPAPEGNLYWKLRQKNGRNKVYKPDELWEAACAYFQWADENPWKKQDFIRGGDLAGNKVELETARPYTIQEMCVHLGISVKTFERYGQDEGFSPIVTHIREIIYSQKLSGAAVGAFNASIIARDLGLTDKQETKFNADINHTITGMIVE